MGLQKIANKLKHIISNEQICLFLFFFFFFNKKIILFVLSKVKNNIEQNKKLYKYI